MCEITLGKKNHCQIKLCFNIIWCSYSYLLFNQWNVETDPHSSNGILRLWWTMIISNIKSMDIFVDCFVLCKLKSISDSLNFCFSWPDWPVSIQNPQPKQWVSSHSSKKNWKIENVLSKCSSCKTYFILIKQFVPSTYYRYIFLKYTETWVKVNSVFDLGMQSIVP